jgi:hypothetical protein
VTARRQLGHERLVSSVGAVVAGLGTLCTSALSYAPFLLPEVLAYPTFCLCAYLCVRALAGGGRRWVIAAILACAVAVAVRSQLVCVGAAFAVAAAVLWLCGPRAREAATASLRTRSAPRAGVGGLIAYNAVTCRSTNGSVTQSYKDQRCTQRG